MCRIISSYLHICAISEYDETFNIKTQKNMLLALYGNDEGLGKYQKEGISFRQSQISESVK